jgi:hypothetical protein
MKSLRTTLLSRHLRPLSTSSNSGQPGLNFDNAVIITKSCVNVSLTNFEISSVNSSVFQRIKQLQEKSKAQQLYLRLAVEGGGCSGFKYLFKMDDSPISSEEDK